MKTILGFLIGIIKTIPSLLSVFLGFLVLILIISVFIFLVINSVKKKETENKADDKKSEKPEKSEKIGKKFPFIILLIPLLFGVGIGILGTRYYIMNKILKPPSQEILEIISSKFQGQQWKIWILGPGTGSEVNMISPQEIEIQSWEPNFIFSMPYFYRGQKEKSVYTWNMEKEKYGYWSHSNPPKNGYWAVEKWSNDFYSGWISMDEKKVVLWIVK